MANRLLCIRNYKGLEEIEWNPSARYVTTWYFVRSSQGKHSSWENNSIVVDSSDNIYAEVDLHPEKAENHWRRSASCLSLWILKKGYIRTEEKERHTQRWACLGAAVVVSLRTCFWYPRPCPCHFDDDLKREFDDELYEREPFHGLSMVRGARNIFWGDNRHRHGSAPTTPTSFLHLTVTDWFHCLSCFRTQSERREFNDELFGRNNSELSERKPEPLFGFIKKRFNNKKVWVVIFFFFFVLSPLSWDLVWLELFFVLMVLNPTIRPVTLTSLTEGIKDGSGVMSGPRSDLESFFKN